MDWKLGLRQLWLSLTAIVLIFHVVFVSCTCAQSCLILCDPIACNPHLLCLWNFPGQNAGGSCPFLLQGIFLTQGSNLSLCFSCIAGRFFTTPPPGKPFCIIQHETKKKKKNSAKCELEVSQLGSRGSWGSPQVGSTTVYIGLTEKFVWVFL